MKSRRLLASLKNCNLCVTKASGAWTKPRICFSLSTIVLFGVAAACAFQTDGSDQASARSILARMTAATGWTKAAVPPDAVITGTITRYFSDSSPSAGFTIKIRGAEQYRYAEDGSPAVLVTNGPAGALIDGDGKATRIPAHSALSSRGLVLPMASVLSDWDAADVDVTLVGPSSINGEACVGIQVARRHSDGDPMAHVRRLIAPIVVWISTTRGVALRADYRRSAIDNHNVTIPETVLFSDYRNVNGIAVPFQEDILLGQQHIQRLQFSSVRFNTGLTDADFNVAAVAGGAR
jgi:hypothetical protein